MLSDYIELFIDHLHNLNRSELTIQKYKRELKEFESFLGRKKIDEIEKVKMIHLDFYQSELTKKGNSSSSRANKASIHRTFFKFLHSRNYIETNPAISLDPIKIKDTDRKKKETLTVDEAIKLIERTEKNSIPLLKQRNKCILLIFLFCGLRVSELINIELDDIDLKNKILLVNKGKGGKERRVPFNHEVAKEIKEYIKSRKVASSYLFTRKTSSEPLSRRAVHDLIKRHSGKAKLKKNIGCHSLRRTSATINLQSDINIRNIQKFLGHSDISTTMMYLDPDEETVHQQIRDNNILGKKMKRKKKK